MLIKDNREAQEANKAAKELDASKMGRSGSDASTSSQESLPKPPPASVVPNGIPEPPLWGAYRSIKDMVWKKLFTPKTLTEPGAQKPAAEPEKQPVFNPEVPPEKEQPAGCSGGVHLPQPGLHDAHGKPVGGITFEHIRARGRSMSEEIQHTSDAVSPPASPTHTGPLPPPVAVKTPEYDMSGHKVYRY
ncbi:unnamed protein product [Vitrella brassicaformis CCMP3155]|uniref:Uncharacterized protein n=1 Tax=Vitrella brassicaformis (strain CCMP3155) TaxID=1169540 RepID=A0A0G4G3L4_VITBC|nr:unnamed protein product [Vitrella brassicaformis CCMP3155]|eukprot:CEM22874.1 unnamed protein product [Vitrella brassicaformis CCMP3155]